MKDIQTTNLHRVERRVRIYEMSSLSYSSVQMVVSGYFRTQIVHLGSLTEIGYTEVLLLVDER